MHAYICILKTLHQIGENKYSIQRVLELVSWVVGMVAHEIFVSTLGVLGILSEKVKIGHPYHALYSLSHHAADKYKYS